MHTPHLPDPGSAEASRTGAASYLATPGCGGRLLELPLWWSEPLPDTGQCSGEVGGCARHQGALTSR